MSSKMRGRLVILGLALSASAAVLVAMLDDLGVESIDEAGMLFWALAAPVLAVFVEWRVPGNRMGRILLGTGLAGAVGAVSVHYMAAPWAASIDVSEAIWEGVGAFSFFGFFWLTLGLIPLLFPTGRPLSKRWWIPGGAGIAAMVALAPMFFFSEEICSGIRRGVERCALFVENPIGIQGIPHPEYSTMGGVAFGLLLASMAGGVIALIVRFFRSRGLERQQLKLLAFVIVLNLAWIFLADVIWVEILGNDELSGIGGEITMAIAWAAIPVAIAIAITRYRLYDIDRVISRTVSYTVVAGLLALVFGAGVVLVPSLVPGLENDPVLIAGSTLAAAALFNPLRKRIQSWVDRRFNRSRYDAEHVIERFAGSLRNQVDREDLVKGWFETVSRTMQPASASVWMRESHDA